VIFQSIEVDGMAIAGAALIIDEPVEDHRGYFTRLWSDNEAANEGFEHDFNQLNLAFNHRRGTLRGMHFQTKPNAETKLVRVVAGEVWDVILDLRSASPTFLAWWGVELAAGNHLALLLPAGCAHGYQTLADETQVMYQTTHRYVPEAATGARHDDPAFAIRWPLAVGEISSADASWAYWQEDDPRAFAGVV